jgi:dienelactone hydrolase
MRRAFPASVVTVLMLAVLAVGCRAQTPAASQSLRDDFRRMILSDRKSGPLNPQLSSTTDVGNLRVERVKFTPEAGQDAVAVIYRPKEEKKYPAIIVQHFLGGSKDHPVMGLFLPQLAQRGFVVAAIDGRYRGERQNGKSLEAAMVESLRTGKGHPFLVDTTYDILRLTDYLETRPDVDAARIGMTGFSEGGIITWMAAAADDRIKVAAPVIGVTTFKDMLEMADGPEVQARLQQFEPVLKEYARDLGEKEVNAKVLQMAWTKLVPGMVDRFDAPNILPLIAPRPLLILSHEQDELFPVEGARKAYAATKTRYTELKVEDHLDFRVAPGLKHAAFNPGEVMALMQWMDRWLKAPAN